MRDFEGLGRVIVVLLDELVCFKPVLVMKQILARLSVVLVVFGNVLNESPLRVIISESD